MSQLEIFDFPQNSPEWRAARAGIPTASVISTIMAKGRGGGDSVTRRKLMLTLIGERITGATEEGYTNAFMERGHAMEPDARNLYALARDIEPQLVGFMKRCGAGASPDATLGTDGLLEIKTKLPHLQLEVLLSGEIPSEHLPQLFGQLWISQRQWVDFVSYWPGLPMFVHRLERDEAQIARIAEAVAEFQGEMDALQKRIEAM